MKRDTFEERIPTLEKALMKYVNADGVKDLVKHTNEKVPARKGDAAELIEGYLAGDGLRFVWERLDELQQAAVAEVVHSKSTHFPADRFAAKYGGDPKWRSKKKHGRGKIPSLLGFFFYSGIMPDDLKERLKAFVPEPKSIKIKTLPELPAAYGIPFNKWNPKTKSDDKSPTTVPLIVHAAETTAQRELLSVLRRIDAGNVAVSIKTRRPSAAAVEALTQILEGGDFYPVIPVKSKWEDENAGPIRAFAWPLIVQVGGLAELSGTKLRLTKAGRSALSRPAGETLRRLWSRWLNTTIIDELSRIEIIKGQRNRRSLTAVSSRRKAIADTLAECPPGSWISTDVFYRFMRACGNDLIVARNAWDLYLWEQQYGAFGYEGHEPILNERYLLAFLLEYAVTLGIIDAALIPPAGARYNYGDLWGTDDLIYFSRYDGLMYLRITALGAYCLGIETEYRPAPMERKPVLRILPNLEITAIGAELERGDRIALDTYALPVSELVWQLNQSKLLTAIQEGRSIAEVREFLDARSIGTIPDTVIRFLDDTEQRAAKLQDRGLARLIECSDAALAVLIAGDSRTRKHCMPAGERHLVVPSSSEGAFKRALLKLGYSIAAGEITTPKPRRRSSASKKATAPSAGD